MARIKLSRGEQRAFIDAVLTYSNSSVGQLAAKCNVHPRTIRDWRREKFCASYEVLKQLSEETHIPLPRGEILEQYWYAAKGAHNGAMRRLALYGPPGTPEGRSKGGEISQARRRADPEKYRQMGCIIPKKFTCPPHSEKLAELVGIILGDGGITDSHRLEREKEHCIVLVLSGVELVRALESLGLKRGDKIRNQVRVPDWIMNNERYAIACLRGLFDTDGGFYFHRKQSGTYIGWSFCSYSPLLLKDVDTILRKLGLHATTEQGRKLYMYSLEKIGAYMRIVGTHNAKNMMKIQSHMVLLEMR